MNIGVKACKLAAILTVTIWRRTLLHHRVAASVEHAKVLKHLGPVTTVVDIGANCGQFALAARHCFPEAQIVSFEPLTWPATIYRSVFDKDKQARLVEAAVGPETGQAVIHVSARKDSSSLLSITELQNKLFPGTAEKGTETISMATLTDYVSADEIISPALLKLDVQGYELGALQGCVKLLNRFEYVYAECSFVELYEGQALADEVIAWLKENNFNLTGVYNIHYDSRGKAIQGDFLFRNIDVNTVLS